MTLYNVLHTHWWSVQSMKTTRLFFIKEYHPQSILQWATQSHDDVDNNKLMISMMVMIPEHTHPMMIMSTSITLMMIIL